MLYKLFSYGTLMNRSTLEVVIGHPYNGELEDARLEGFVRLRPQFYMAFEDEESHIDGKLISGLTEKDVIRLDRYESLDSGFYRRRTVKVNGEDTLLYYNGEGFVKEDYQ
jgi:gamma-glutamylcyclotransferase (GGCT)/AIG2-like uncharacterized protein YtfP